MSLSLNDFDLIRRKHQEERAYVVLWVWAQFSAHPYPQTQAIQDWMSNELIYVHLLIFTLFNKLAVVKNMIELDWLNLSFNSYRIKC